MIISRTPYRISFFGGGTDYHPWYREHGGAVLSTTINHYCYLTCRYLPPFFKEKNRIVWSKIECTMEYKDIEHPAVRAVLQYLEEDQEIGMEVHHMGDLPARTGLGSSSAFTVGLLNSMNALHGRMSTKRELACEAVHIERDVLKENVGVQDQIAVAYGGFNKITILPTGDFVVQPVIIPQERLASLQEHFLLFFTGVSRNATDVAAEQIKSINNKKLELEAMRKLVDEAVDVLVSSKNLNEFGRLLHETWQIKRTLSTGIAPQFIDDVYDKAKQAGATGGKLLGAGGGGFMLFFAPPEKHDSIKKALDDLLWVPFSFETAGSSIVFYDPNSYAPATLNRRDFQHLSDQKNSSSILNPDKKVIDISTKKKILTV